MTPVTKKPSSTHLPWCYLHRVPTLAEPFPVDAETLEPRKLNGYEIASRLSYFLWSSMPDSQLWTLHEKETLRRKGPRFPS